jgi:hypothetical protein
MVENVIHVLRDLVIIIFGIVWIVAGALVALVAWLAYKFIRSLPGRAEIVKAPAEHLYGQAQQVMETAGDSARTAREAVTFVSSKAVLPTITAVSAVVGVRQFLQTLLRGDGQRESEP